MGGIYPPKRTNLLIPRFRYQLLRKIWRLDFVIEQKLSGSSQNVRISLSSSKLEERKSKPRSLPK
jgi:hypothetical protein